jgi:hypothetical protein
MNTIDLVNAALVGDSGAFKNAFDAAISARVNDALEVKKVEIASSLLTPEVQTNEIEGLETEIDGSTESEVDAGVTSNAE